MMAEYSLLRRWENVIFQVFSVVCLEPMLKTSLGKDTLSSLLLETELLFLVQKLKCQNLPRLKRHDHACLLEEHSMELERLGLETLSKLSFIQSVTVEGWENQGKHSSVLFPPCWADSGTHTYTKKNWNSYLRYFSEVIVSSKFRIISNLLPLFVL